MKFRPQIIMAFILLSFSAGLFPEIGVAENMKPEEVLPRIVSAKDIPSDYSDQGPVRKSGSTNTARKEFGKGGTLANIAIEVSRHKTTVSFLESKMGSIVKYYTDDADMVFSRNLGLGERSFHTGTESIIQPDNNSKYVSQNVKVFWQEWRLTVSISHYTRIGQGVQQDFTDHEAGQLLRSLARKIYPRFLKVVRDGSTDDFTADMADVDLESEKRKGSRADWCKRERERLIKQDPIRHAQGYIATVIAATGTQELDLCTGKLRDNKKGMPIRLGDCIRTGPDGRARIQFHDRDDKENRGPSVLNMATNTEICFDSFDMKPKHKTTIDLIKGTVREFIKGWRGKAQANIKTGTTICGIRGSDVVVSYDPDNQKTHAYVIDGHADMRNTNTGQSKSLTAGQKITVNHENLGPVQTLSQPEWNTLVSQNGLDYTDPDQQTCTQNFPGTIPTGNNAEGRLVCECPAGVIWDKVSRSCPQAASQTATADQESCTQNFSGTSPTGRNAEGRLVCECPGGAIWDKSTGKCPPRSTQTEEDQSGAKPVFVTKAMGTQSATPGGAEYDKATVNVFVDPITTLWVAWNDTPGVSKKDGQVNGALLWGGGGYGTDDFIRLTITTPEGRSASVDMDKNNAYGAHQRNDPMNVIFGAASDAPNALRIDAFGNTSGNRIVFNEAGAFNELFRIPGNYKFDFSFRNQFTRSAGHSDVYLLIQTKTIRGY